MLLLWLVVLFLSPVYAVTVNGDPAQREAPICGAIKEPFVFWLWSRMAPRAKPTRATRHAHVEAVSFETGDGKKLSGYRVGAHDGSGELVEPKGYVLMALGNAMIADQMIGELSAYARAGYDAYIYDYRGYGLSEGKRRINAILEDYREIVTDLNGKYQRKMLYGVSLGGMVMMNTIGAGVDFDAAVIDSAPSRLSNYGCPDRIDPVNHLSEASATKLLIITGKRDQVLGPKDTRELREQAGAMGAKTYDGENFAHPYMDRMYDVHLQRVRLVQEHLLPPASSR
ncbi:MAG: alpha/beta hydrolase [Betaproteobacteria bacterium]|nr:MAG: alpha/beta hydrolase [Betaproteobacteria bacterium]